MRTTLHAVLELIELCERGQWCSATEEVTAGLAESNGSAYRRVDDLRSPAGWLPLLGDQLQAQRSVWSIGKPLPLPLPKRDVSSSIMHCTSHLTLLVSPVSHLIWHWWFMLFHISSVTTGSCCLSWCFTAGGQQVHCPCARWHYYISCRCYCKCCKWRSGAHRRRC